MTLLRIHGSLLDPPHHCAWILSGSPGKPLAGEGPLAGLPRGADRTHLVIPAAQVLLARAHLPPAARRRRGSALAYAIEEQTAGDPDANQVSWLGVAGDADILSVIDAAGLARWKAALAAVGIRRFDVHCETLLLPRHPGEWSLAWNGQEGFVRTGALEGAATDVGDRSSPPLSLRLLLAEARTRAAVPSALALHATAAGAAPDLGAWSSALGLPVRDAGPFDWRSAPAGEGVSLVQLRQRWEGWSGAATRLRPAAAVVGAALAIHAVALVVQWAALSQEERGLRRQMEAQFRAAFPDALAVSDPALQMRRKTADARHAAGQPDDGDFLPMIARVASAAKDLPPGTLRAFSFEAGRLSLELAAADEALLRRIGDRLAQAGLQVAIADAKRLTVRAP